MGDELPYKGITRLTIMNTLYYGDNLDILRRYIQDESVDLIYLDPPFNSNADYNVLFAEKYGAKAPPRSRPSKTLGTGTPPAQAYEETSPTAARSPSLNAFQTCSAAAT